jgi:hypothetical protein
MRPRLLSRAIAVAACALVTPTLAACESTQHESTQLELQSRAAQAAELAKERAAKKRAHEAHKSRSHGKSATSAHGAAKG